ncbi:DivIVA domain-containing protein [Deinococcus sp.]|uniref:DivIVA domain-containing protein n=1 Tax=Deinococcus sp. TaxID=47478 RepID=UPI0025DA1291|nr:DivIVA domain-containing protein [Deinococcus sp.]
MTGPRPLNESDQAISVRSASQPTTPPLTAQATSALSSASPLPPLEAVQTALQTPRHTPIEVQRQEFAAAMRGYKKSDVRMYLSEVSQTLEDGLRERAELHTRLGAALRQLQIHRETEDELRRTLIAAERIGAELKEQARQEAMLTIQGAENKVRLLEGHAAVREQEASTRHESRLRELEATFSLRRAQLEAQCRDQEHELEIRSRERSAVLEREFSVHYADLSGRLSAAQAEYAQFMSQYRAVSQAFAQAAHTHLMPELPSLPNGLPNSLHSRLGDAIMERLETLTEPPRPTPAAPTANPMIATPPAEIPIFVTPSESAKHVAGTAVTVQPGMQPSPEAAAVQIEEQRFS